MKTTDIINYTINRLPIGYVFTYDDFSSKVKSINTLIKVLNQLVKDGKIRKLSPGRFYKPQMTEFGELKPDIFQVVKDLLDENGRIIGYLTAYSIYNQLGLTTQMSAIIQIGVNEPKKSLNRGMYRVKFIKQANNITKENITLLRILDSINKIKEIPDTTIEQSIIVLQSIIQNLELSKMEFLIKLAKKYPPATRALTGAIIENCSTGSSVDILFRSLNPASEFKFGINEKSLPNKSKWRIL